MTVSLQQISLHDLNDLAESRTPAAQQSRAIEGGLPPPPLVAARAVQHLAAGKCGHWCATFYVVRASDHKIVGSCGFKGEPVAGRVGIGYGMAPACRGQGIATAAVKLLVQLAFEQGVRQVMAEILPDNITSAQAAEKLEFKRLGARLDEAGEWVAEWVVERVAQVDKVELYRLQNQ